MKENKKNIFSKNFLWGVATSSHQTEGENKNNDWWQWEFEGKTKEVSGTACDSWNRFQEDHQLVQDLGCNAYRLSLEWSKIEPRKGEFSLENLEHYRQILLDLKKRKIKRVVTLWHWTLPLWLVKEVEGWHKEEIIPFFENYCQKVVDFLGKEIDLLIIFNEPRIVLGHGYLKGIFPPGKKNFWQFQKAENNMLKAYFGCYDGIKERNSDLKIGITQYCLHLKYLGKSKLFKKIFQKIEDWYNWNFQQKIGLKQDFIGFNYYKAFGFRFSWPFLINLKKENLASDWNWGFYPLGIEKIALRAKKIFDKPIYILENGLADEKDVLRARYLKEHLLALKRAKDGGADIRGYFHWSLLDNFEWAEGFWPKFGLVKVDFKTFKRTPQKSFFVYQKIIKNNSL